jgi:hypothetical protein
METGGDEDVAGPSNEEWKDQFGHVWRVGAKIWLNWPYYELKQPRICLALKVQARSALGLFVRGDCGPRAEKFTRGDPKLMVLSITADVAEVFCCLSIIFCPHLVFFFVTTSAPAIQAWGGEFPLEAAEYDLPALLASADPPIDWETLRKHQNLRPNVGKRDRTAMIYSASGHGVSELFRLRVANETKVGKVKVEKVEKPPPRKALVKVEPSPKVPQPKAKVPSAQLKVPSAKVPRPDSGEDTECESSVKPKVPVSARMRKKLAEEPLVEEVSSSPSSEESEDEPPPPPPPKKVKVQVPVQHRVSSSVVPPPRPVSPTTGCSSSSCSLPPSALVAPLSVALAPLFSLVQELKVQFAALSDQVRASEAQRVLDMKEIRSFAPQVQQAQHLQQVQPLQQQQQVIVSLFDPAPCDFL